MTVLEFLVILYVICMYAQIAPYMKTNNTFLMLTYIAIDIAFTFSMFYFVYCFFSHV